MMDDKSDNNIQENHLWLWHIMTIIMKIHHNQSMMVIIKPMRPSMMGELWVQPWSRTSESLELQYCSRLPTCSRPVPVHSSCGMLMENVQRLKLEFCSTFLDLLISFWVVSFSHFSSKNFGHVPRTPHLLSSCGGDNSRPGHHWSSMVITIEADRACLQNHPKPVLIRIVQMEDAIDMLPVEHIAALMWPQSVVSFCSHIQAQLVELLYDPYRPYV